MNNLIKWWKDKTFITILCVIFVTMLVSVLVSFLQYGWILSIIVALIGGFIIRQVIIKELKKMGNSN